MRTHGGGGGLKSYFFAGRPSCMALYHLYYFLYFFIFTYRNSWELELQQPRLHRHTVNDDEITVNGATTCYCIYHDKKCPQYSRGKQREWKGHQLFWICIYKTFAHAHLHIHTRWRVPGIINQQKWTKMNISFYKKFSRTYSKRSFGFEYFKFKTFRHLMNGNSSEITHYLLGEKWNRFFQDWK